MPNRLTIDVFQRVHMRTLAVDYTVDVYDDNAHTTLVFPCGHKVINSDNKDDMELLTEIIRASVHSDEHGSSADLIWDMLENLRGNEQAINIGGKRYEWSEIKETMRYSFRNLYECPKCGNTSWDDDCGDCPECVDGGQMQFVTEEHFEL